MKIQNKVSAKLLSSLFVPAILLLSNCKKEENLIPETSENTSAISADSLDKLSVSSSSLSSSVYRLERSLPSGYVKDGSRDYTSYVQAAINKYSVIAFPGFPILVNDKGINIPSNRKIYFIDGSEIRLKASSKSAYNIINIEKASNVTLIDPVIKGDKRTHNGTSGEWGMGIGIYSSTNITLESPKVTDCWGDGIYVGTADGGINRNIVIRDAYLRANRRDGISIISVDGLKLESPYAGYHTERSPYCGINIEPNSSRHEVKNVSITNARTEYNKGQGVQMTLKHLYGGSDKFVDANIENLRDVGSRIAFKISANSSYRRGSETVNGKIYVRSVYSKNYTYIPVMVATAGEENLKTILTNPEVIKSGTTSTLSSSSFTTLFKGSCVARGSQYSLYL